ncbi:MAG: hypothetical protein ACJAVT_001692, partial [Yoonia sp.]
MRFQMRSYVRIRANGHQTQSHIERRKLVRMAVTT